MSDLLPTKTEIRAMRDYGALQALHDETVSRAERINVDLAHRPGDDDWHARARTALYHTNYTRRIVERHMRTIAKPGSERLDSDNDPLTNAVVNGTFVVNAFALTTDAEIEAAFIAIAQHMDALHLDRADEMEVAGQQRDMAWLMKSGAGIKRLGRWRMDLQNVRGQANKALQAARQKQREQLFIQVAKAMLDEPIYKALWVEVEKRQAAL